MVMRIKVGVEIKIMIALALVALCVAIFTIAKAVSDDAGGGFSCTDASITDGIVLQCREIDQDGNKVHVRLAGINARTSRGACAPILPCPDALAEFTRAELGRLATGQALTCRDIDMLDGSIVAFCTNESNVDLSCALVASGAAARWQRYWAAHRC